MTSLVDWYLPLRHLHITLVTISISLFTLRGAAVLAGHNWPMKTGLRRASVLIDTGLLSAGVALWLMLGLNPTVQTWLGAKLVLVVVYIVLGVFALKRAPTWRRKFAFYVASLLCAAWIVSIALTHDAAGWLSYLPG